MSKISINLEESSLSFLEEATDNRSRYINELIQREKKKIFEAKLEADYSSQSQDPKWQQEVKLWDSTSSDGLDDSTEGMIS